MEEFRAVTEGHTGPVNFSFPPVANRTIDGSFAVGENGWPEPFVVASGSSPSDGDPQVTSGEGKPRR